MGKAGLLLALVLGGQQAQTLDAITQSQLQDLLGRLGYTCDFSQAGMGRIWIADRPVECSFVTTGKRPGTPSSVVAIRLTYRYAPEALLPPKLLQIYADNFAMASTCPNLRFCPDGRLKISTSIRVGDGGTEKRLLYDLDSYSSAIWDLVERYPPAKKALPIKIDLKAPVVAMDAEDVRTLATAWGMEWKGGYGGSFSTWAQPMNVGGLMVWIDGNRRDGLFVEYDHIAFGLSFYLDENTNSQKAIAEMAKKLRPIEVWGESGNRISLGERVDLSKGMTFGELKSRLEKFARKVMPYAKGRQR